MKLFRVHGGFVILAALCLVAVPALTRADIGDEIANLRTREAELQAQIAQYQQQAAAVGAQSKTLQNEITKLNAQIAQINAQIRSLDASIGRTGLEIQQTEMDIMEAERRIQLHQSALAEVIRDTDETDQQSLAVVLLRHAMLSEFFNHLNNVQRTQDTLRLTIQAVKEVRADLDAQRESLEQHQAELEQLKVLEEIQQRQFADTTNNKNQLLKQTKGQEEQYQKLVQQGQKDLQRLREQITYLLQGGLTLEDAVSFAKLAAIGAGIRPAFLLALLEVESRMGQNVGTGNWRDDMYLCYQRLATYYPSKRDYYLKRAEDEKIAYLSIMSALGLDPDSQKVSREPTYGCGGAMGPAQFIPTTWLGYAAAVTNITGHNPPNPWNFQDAFSASALKLAKGGATSQDRVGEIRAAKAYISGNPNCTSATCNSYANTILQKAADIERDL
ncbi:MAG TPA: lytic murein transglycosylase [Candidatus Paceibacterota bacterium]|nr:lytic murein transglycosylase [Candidatus Paceibacterota bacterium]